MPVFAALPANRLWKFLFAVLAARLVLMLVVMNGSDLAGDEAYYWDWGRRPDWCYYSKPPMIGWLMGVIGWLTGNAEWGVRLAALLFGTSTLILVWRVARDLFDESTALLAACLVLLTPGNAGQCLLLTIDAPLLFAWTLALWLYWRAAEKPTSWPRWLLLGLTLGFGCLSKQMMLVFPVLMIAFAAVSREDRALLKNPRFWAACVLGLLFMIPVVKWNQEHGWITVEHTKHHFDSEKLSFGRWISRLGENIGLQALLYTPVLFSALVMVLWRHLRAFAAMSRAQRYVWVFAAPVLAVFAVMALLQRINPNWPAAFFVPAIVLAAAWLAGAEGASWRRWSLRVAAGITLVLHLALLAVMITPLRTIKKVASLRGWREAGVEAQVWLEKMPRKENTFVLALGHRYHAAWMAFYMPSHPRVYRWEVTGVPQSQYEVWPGPEERIGDDALVLMPVEELDIRPLAEITDCFERFDRIGTIEVPLGEAKRVFAVYHGVNLKTWKAIRP